MPSTASPAVSPTVSLDRQRAAAGPQQAKRRRAVRPSVVDPADRVPYTPDQELEVFGSWVGEPIWAPPTGRARALAETMHARARWFASDEERWQTVVETHRREFTQVREIDLSRASIRLPEGRFFVAVTEQKDFGRIEEDIPACVQTRLDEFLAGPGRRPGVKVSYLKPLCVEDGEHLILTTEDDLQRALDRVREEALSEYRGMAALWRLHDVAVRASDLLLAVPRAALRAVISRREKALARYQAALEFKRRKTALGAMKNYQKCRTSGCTFDDMYALTNPLQKDAVARQHDAESREKNKKRDQIIKMAAESAPWVLSLLGGSGGLIGHFVHYMLWTTPPVLLCDPAFVAEMPDRPGELLKIGHFDEVGGVTHVEV